nr:unnamed protein product [Spirometra erinaceieuropaei]
MYADDVKVAYRHKPADRDIVLELLKNDVQAFAQCHRFEGVLGFYNDKGDNFLRKYNWSEKARRRKTTGTGRCLHLKKVHRRFRNGFRSGPPKAKAAKSS